MLKPNNDIKDPLDFSKTWFPTIPSYDLPSTETLSYNKTDWKVNHRKAALLVHDMQNYWVERFIEPKFIIDNVRRIIEICREHDIPIIYSVGERARNLAERGLSLDLWGPGIGSSADVKKEDPNVIEAFAPQNQDFVVHKTKYSAFFKTELENVMQKTGRNQLLISGIFAHHGCLVTALDAFMRNIETFMIADATADYSKDEHLMALRYVAETSGVISTIETIQNDLK